ncbi:MAG TPA: extracellular solute-binding protein [Candidatus Acetatifactor stercoripullorum]|uniref:Extracellular solute-binding protein n=1 Tax=Candidatus Acetatifactor stercoripullorum TaxID=2838414 RepID=A0A9D1R4R1_9FIRM|nr:extracellular solute-binding protein [Candidatus Acetatifactor stercoripullorum]HIW80825.1 extracellular solute-binding protein [Candidatus Acetatifactor stercoripullorum]
MMKKILCLGLCAALTAAGLAGCSTEQTDQSASQDTVSAETTGTAAADAGTETAAGETAADPLRADEGTTISVAHCQGEYIYESFYEISDKFTEMTGIEVEWIELPATDYDTWVTAQFAAGTEPDIFWNAPKEYFDQGKIMDLTAYYDQENVFNGVTWKDCFTDGALVNSMSTDGTKYISTAMTGFTFNLYYNKDIMEELGLGTEPPETFTEMIEMMKVCKEDGRYIPMSVQNLNDTNVGWLERIFMDDLFHNTDVVEKLDIITPNGAIDYPEAMLGLETGVLNYDDPRFEEYFTLMKDLTQYWNEDYNAAGWEYEGLFNNGEVLFNVNGGWYPGQVVENGYEVNYGAAPMPYVDSAYSEFGLDEPLLYAPPAGEAVFFISQKCADEGRGDAAVKFLQFMTCPEGGAQMYIDAVMLGSCIKGVTLPEEVGALANAETGDAVTTWVQLAFQFSDEAYSKYRELYVAYLDPSSTQTAAELIAELKEEVLPLLDEAIEDSTVDVMSYVDQVQG